MRRVAIISAAMIGSTLVSGCFDFVHRTTATVALSGVGCDDRLKTGDETDVDCGGSCPAKCGFHAGCGDGDDCASGICLDGTCDVPGCGDGIKNNDESDVDCGGSCGPCTNGKICGDASDCATQTCVSARCADANCADGVMNTNETDVDCGGGCPGCGVNKACAVAADCASTFCHPTNHTCATPTCSDSFKNGDESDMDCGGSCPACINGKTCGTSADCASTFCHPPSGTCTVPSCSDGFKNGTETDVDCGGSATCSKCARGKACAGPSDCWNNQCFVNTCTGVCPSTMAAVAAPPPFPGKNYCIDKLEVSQVQYASFLSAGIVFAQLPQCAWDTSRDPRTLGRGCSGATYASGSTNPIRCVDWCDAAAYCMTKGKRLCGSVPSGATLFTTLGNGQDSQWYYACTNAMNSAYFYNSGDLYSASKCNGSERVLMGLGPDTILDPGALVNCKGFIAPYDTIFDMNGNVHEWTDECMDVAMTGVNTGGTDRCATRGGSFGNPAEITNGQNPSNTASCETFVDRLRNDYAHDVGFRCCAL